MKYEKASCLFVELEKMQIDNKLSDELIEFLRKMDLLSEDDLPYLSYDEWEKTPNSIFLIIENMKEKLK